MQIEEILQLVESVSQSGLTEFKYEEGTVKLSLKSTTNTVLAAAPAVMTSVEAPVPAVQPAALTSETTEAVPAKEIANGKIVKCPLVGTFYSAPSEDAAPFVKIGDSVKEGQILAIVEAMKLMNDIESDFNGTIVDILVQNGETVEYGQPLFVIA